MSNDCCMHQHFHSTSCLTCHVTAAILPTARASDVQTCDGAMGTVAEQITLLPVCR
jgi:hypothetical protein